MKIFSCVLLAVLLLAAPAQAQLENWCQAYLEHGAVDRAAEMARIHRADREAMVANGFVVTPETTRCWEEYEAKIDAAAAAQCSQAPVNPVALALAIEKAAQEGEACYHAAVTPKP